MEKINGVKINTVVRVGEKDADPAKVSGLPIENGKYIVDVPDMAKRVEARLEGMSMDELREAATKEVYIREQDAVRNGFRKGATGAGLRETARLVINLLKKKGFSEDEITLMSPEEKIANLSQID